MSKLSRIVDPLGLPARADARTGRSIDLAAFSRLREPAATSGSVMG
jgi:hypothetical protein